jgi:hypothetical protein
MNKLLISDDVCLNNNSYELKLNSKEVTIEIEGNVKVYLINQKTNILNIKIKDNSELLLYKFNNIENNLIVNIYQNNDSRLFYNESITNNLDNLLTINNYIDGNNNESNINIRNVCNNLNSVIDINVYIKKDTTNNVALEDLKGITNGGGIHIEPNIVCESNEVVANHLTTIGNINEDAINYLMSKGITNDDAKELLIKGFIYSNMDNYIKEIMEVNKCIEKTFPC